MAFKKPEHFILVNTDKKYLRKGTLIVRSSAVSKFGDRYSHKYKGAMLKAQRVIEQKESDSI